LNTAPPKPAKTQQHQENIEICNNPNETTKPQGTPRRKTVEKGNCGGIDDLQSTTPIGDQGVDASAPPLTGATL
jgi:hypothetical protein